MNCDEPEVKEMLANINTSELKMLIGNNRIIVIDEAQRVSEIGLTLKRITDNFTNVQLLVTGSSSFELQSNLSEPLTGRKYEYHLYPISTAELYDSQGLLPVKQMFESRLIYGSYPDIEVSYNEVAQTIGTDNKTVEKYIDLLEKCYVIFRLNAFNRNLRTELKKSKKIYFYDNGIRNAVIQNFAPLSLRQDTGALWENFFISERIKANHYNGNYAKSFFWRTTQQQEIDYIEEADGNFTAFEMKWNPNKRPITFPSPFLNNYPVKETVVITPENYLEWVM